MSEPDRPQRGDSVAWRGLHGNRLRSWGVVMHVNADGSLIVKHGGGRHTIAPDRVVKWERGRNSHTQQISLRQ